MEKSNIVIIGGAFAGMMTGLALARKGHSVTVLDWDPGQLPKKTDDLFEQWNRIGCPQTKHAHAFLARVHNEIRDNEPELLQALLDHGAEELTFLEMVGESNADYSTEQGDEDLTSLACRRILFDWVLRNYLLEKELVEIKSGQKVVGLLSELASASLDAPQGISRIVGVQAEQEDGSIIEIPADFVIDASGRTSKLPTWLGPHVQIPVSEESEDSGIIYCSRWYKLKQGQPKPSNEMIILGALGYVAYGVFPSDNNIFAVILASSKADDEMRCILRTPGFETVSTHIPKIWEWINPEVSDPISQTWGMANLNNTRRNLIVDGEPIVLGIATVGDSGTHLNPTTGRGCTLAAITAYGFADIYADNNNVYDIAMAYDQFTESEIIPWYELQLQEDRASIQASELSAARRKARAAGEKLSTRGSNAMADMRKNMMAVVKSDVFLLRRFMRMMMMLDKPADVMNDPELLMRAMKLAQENQQSKQEPMGPRRSEMMEIIQNSGAST